ncbi:hypothetical protein DFH09DRAFT_1367083 [Mycena vulgaris]|nr:hypothetical protein DFH09DRAFT_1367083 [Mycena vulgaris]
MRMDEEEISAMSPHPRCAGDALHLLPLPSPASPVSITHHSCLVVVTRDLSPPSSLPILPFILRLARAQSFPARVSSAPYPARSLLPGPSASFSDTAFLPNPAPAAQDTPACCARHPDEVRARHVITRSSSSSYGARTRMSPLPPRTSLAPRETPAGGEGGDRGEDEEELYALRVRSTVHVAPRGCAHRLRRPSRRGVDSHHTHHTHGDAFASQHTRAHTRRRARRRASALVAHAMLVREEQERDRGGVRVRACRRTSGGAGSTGGEKETSAGTARAPPAIHGVGVLNGAPFEDGWCMSMPTTARARGDAPAPKSARSSSTPTPRSSSAVDRSYSRLRIHPTSHSHRARRRFHARLSFDLSLVSGTFPSSTSILPPPPPITRGRGLGLGRRVGGGGGIRGGRVWRGRIAGGRGREAEAEDPVVLCGVAWKEVDRGGLMEGGCDASRRSDAVRMDARRAETAPPMGPWMCGATPWASASSGNASGGRARATMPGGPGVVGAAACLLE